jgi:hypothetical protein
MQVANHFFENAMTFFTSMLQISISFTVANGDGTSSTPSLVGSR